MVKVSYTPIKTASSVCINVGFPIECDAWTIDGLMQGIVIPSKHQDINALLFSTYKLIESKISPNMAAGAKSKILSITPKSNQNNFTLTFICSTQLSSIRKALSILFANINKSSYQSYSNIIRQLGYTPNHEAYNFAYAALLTGLKSVSMIITGKMVPAKIMPIIETTSAKMTTQQVAGTKTKRQFDDEFTPTMGELKAPNLQSAILLHEYFKAAQFSVKIIGLSVFHQPTTITKLTDKTKVQKYVEKFLTLGPLSTPQLINIGAKLGCNPSQLNSIPDSLNKTTLTNEIIKAMG
ncbi:MAG: hypothetical protein KAS12_01655 [Candidatus Aenigmarchaeota archaeon]|nr:hypothetical protein [Candidatus Aenigmarchaeota archaeon]